MADFGHHILSGIIEAQDHRRFAAIHEAQQVVIVLWRRHPVLLMAVADLAEEMHVLRPRSLESDEGDLADAQGMAVPHRGGEPPRITMPKETGVLEAGDWEGGRIRPQGVIIDRLDGEDLEIRREVD